MLSLIYCFKYIFKNIFSKYRQKYRQIATVKSQSPPPLPEKIITGYASGVTRRNSGGDCRPSLSLS